MAYPVTLTEVKEHLKIDTNNFENDNYLANQIIPAAVEFCARFVDPSALISDASCPYTVKQAILITCGDLFDNERDSYSLQSIKKSDVALRYMMPHKKIYW